jgi:hypothetical protein
MPEKTSYYALVDSRSSRERPKTVLRRIENADGQTDEIFSRDLRWEPSPLLHGAERGDTMVEFVPVTEVEASVTVERIRAEAAQAE